MVEIEYENKRKYPRLSAKHLISYEYFDDEQTEDIEGLALSQNVSIGGVLIEIDREVQKGGTLLLEIALKDHVIKATGLIVHCKKTMRKKFDIGIRFTQIDPSDLEVLANYYDERGIDLDFEGVV
ncbi:PilZ domain-containing protein [candidate division CSSED10-310 bacterium]|uniref:PilZ domain-containing protein n=1 Tax=candidate division CSSED10-310 bacterium TaxID=2855610 RepID=A0ABV6Z5T1_UNCC1